MTSGAVAAGVTAKLRAAFAPEHLEVLNESSNHNVPKDAETHFKVIIISLAFDSLALIERHRAVNECLAEELASGVHALSIVAKTPAQWAKANGVVSQSPPCLGGAMR